MDTLNEGGATRATALKKQSVAVLIPCYNEGTTIETVVQQFRRALPDSAIYVYDNNSTDDTIARAQAAGANVQRERLQGKGNVVRRMLADIDADIYLMVDGDATYDASAAPAMLDLLISEHLDMVNGTRITDIEEAYRPGHRLGNIVLTWLVRATFGNGIVDMLSGYKVLSRRLVKSMPLLSAGFEIETELAVHALSLRMPIGEVPTIYRERPAGSESKLNTYRDGVRILSTIFILIKEERPLSFFGCLAGLFVMLSLGVAAPLIVTYLETGLVPRLPTAVLSAAVMLLGFLSMTCGLILDTVTRGRKEAKRMAYLAAGATTHRS
jgi:glycosyltransferase involved in cell wall biosynthesis